MRTATRLGMAGIFAALVCISLSCTGEDDNDGPINSWLPPEASRVPVLRAEAERTYVGLGDTVTIRVEYLADTAAGASGVAGREVTVTPANQNDWISSAVLTTGPGGIAEVRFFSNVEGQALITFRSGNLQRTVAVEVTDNAPRNMTIHASPSVLAADGSSKSTITVQVKNDDNNPYVGDVIKFVSNAGLITAESVTDAEGKASATLTSDRRNAVATVTASLKNDGSRSVRIAVEFSGVALTPSVSHRTIKPNGTDTSRVTFTLRDAGNNPIVGEKIDFSFADRERTTFYRAPDSITNSRGEASATIVSLSNGHEWIVAKAAGTEAGADVFLSDQNIAIEEDPNNVYVVGKGTSRFTAVYTSSDGEPIEGAIVFVTVTAGTFSPSEERDPTRTVFADFGKTDESGRFEFNINNPNFTGEATVYVRGETGGGGPSAVADLRINFRSDEDHTVTLVSSPAVIGTNNGVAKITATVTDRAGNRREGVVVSFNIIDGPGGGERLDAATAATGADGTASVNLIAGSLPSSYQGVQVVASCFRDYPRSAPALITIAGPPKNITVRRSVSAVASYAATFGVMISALVSDINGNPVPDGTPVTFGADVTGYRVFRKAARPGGTAEAGFTMEIDTVAMEPIITSEWVNRNRPYTPYPAFYDINRNGKPDRYTPGTGNNPVEPCHPKDSVFIQSNGRQCSEGLWADFNGNGVWDWTETFVDPAYNSSTHTLHDALYANDPFSPNAQWDMDWNGNGVADPQTTILLTRTVQTKNGVAENEIVYGQSDAEKIQATIVAEAQGLLTASALTFILPKPGAAGWNYFE